MSNIDGTPRIMVVEDEGIIAQDIKNCLEGLGYLVPDVVFTGKEAILRAEELRPDLVLMDIVLKGDIDGIETAAEIRKKYNIPIVYLTAYEDDRTLKRAKMTEPLGYILKPFEERYLRSSIEMALYKHQMETKLKENERWLSAILKSVGDAVIVTDEFGFIKFLNPVAETLTGWTLAEVAGKRANEVLVLLDEDSKEPMLNPIERVLAENIIIGRSNHTVLIARNGREVSIDHSSSPLRDDKGRLTGAVLILQDITERKIAETALRESETKFRNLFDYATDAIFVQALNGRIISVNNQASKLLGYTKEELAKMKFSELINENIIDNTFMIYSSLKEKGNYQFETEYRRKDGTYVDVEISMRLIKLFDEEVVQLFVRDITERKLAQEKIDMLAMAVKGITECVSITDLDGKVIFVNDAFETIYGYSKEEILGKPITIVRSPNNPPNINEQIIEQTDRGGWQGELINRTKDGREFPVYLSTSILKNDSGKAAAHIGIASDITERKKAEEAVKQSEKRFQDLYDSAPDMYFSISPTGRVKSVNRFGSEYLGYTSDELIGNEVWKVVHPDDRELVIERISEIFSKKLESAKLEFRKLRKDGTVIWVNESTRLISDINGIPKELFIICRDITPNKEFQIALLESEKKYRNLAQNAPVSVARFSMTSNDFEYANDEFARQMGCSVEEYSHLSRTEKTNIIYVEDRKKVQDNYDHWKKNGFKGMLHFDYRIFNLKKELIWLDTFIYADFDDTGRAVVMNEICIDITERKKAELTILESEKKYKNLAANAPIAVTRISADTMKYEYVNDEFTRQTGYTMEEYNALSAEELKAMAFPEDRQRVNEFFNKWRNEGFKDTQHIDYRTFNRLGEIIWVDTFLFADFDESGKVGAINQICIDITEQKKAQEKIVENENKYKNLAANAPVAVTRVMLKTGAYDFVNSEFIRQSGYSMDEFNHLNDMQLVEMIHHDDREKVFNFYKDWAAVRYTGTQHMEYRIINRHKSVLWLDTYLYAEYDSSKEAVAINQICIDVTERKKAEEELTEKDKRFRALIDNITDLISLVDASGKIIYASPSVTKMLGYEDENYTGRNIFDFINDEDRHSAENMFREVLTEEGKIVNNIQLRFRNKNGDWIWHEATAHNLINDPSIRAIVFNYRDITERKKAEQEILLQKSYFQQLFENSPEGIVVLDNQDRILNANKGFERMFQFSADEIKGKTLNDIIVPESMLEQATQMTLFVLKGEIIHRETERKRKDGSTVDVSVLAYPITLEENQIGVYGIYSDITERKETEKALRNSEERYRAFVKQSTEGIWRFEFLEPVSIKLPIDEQVKNVFKYGYLAECNDVFAKMYGYETAGDIAGARIGELLIESEPKNIDYIRKSIMGGYKIDNVESVELDKHGNKRIFMNNLVGIVENEALIRIWGSQRDITDSKRAQEELSKTQFRLATLLKNLQDVVLYETGGGKEFMSENVFEMLGYNAELFNNRDFFKTITHPGDWVAIEEKTKEWHKAGSLGVLNLEFRVRRADGTYIWVEDHMIKVKNNGDSHMAGVLINITEHKTTEGKLKQLAEKLSQSNKELEQFAYVASHDLQEPLRMVASYIQLLQRRYKGNITAEADEFINYAVDGVVRMKTLINDLLAYSRVNTKEAPLEDVDCTKVVEQNLKNLSASIAETRATVNYENLPTVRANQMQINQLFQNLISNAIKFRKPDVDPVVNISAKHAGDEWLFTVSDNGIGIDKEFSDKIFVIFQRLHNSSEYPGTGIGLAICKKIIEKLGGHLWVESEPGQGSTFTFTIPDKE
ncbi:MAG TPA: PAS domain S-box protein [Ignavibacteria bacterium]|nr:PAS domain S-box protein [Ignavibacteria bacterium]HRJ04686.1 PAS domain S-box protein [Ignavibacteria bacterium]HRJ84753.1 PAS domain S-box protein [Ignavibacteria bacterium]